MSFFFLFSHLTGFAMSFWSATLVCPASGLRVTGFRVPNLALHGSDVELDCAFSAARNAKLYSVKWYQNSDEFYRYMFGERTPVTAFARPGIHVDVSSHQNFSSSSCHCYFFKFLFRVEIIWNATPHFLIDAGLFLKSDKIDSFFCRSPGFLWQSSKENSFDVIRFGS